MANLIQKTDFSASDFVLGAGAAGTGQISINPAILGAVPDATETVKGKVELATAAEAIAGTDIVRAVTPAGMAAAVGSLVPAASTTVAGKVELADNTEMAALTDATKAATPGAIGNWLTNNDVSIHGMEVGIGGGALSSNVRVGNLALEVNTSGSSNTAVGATALGANTSGAINTAIGNGAMALNTTGGDNVAVGRALGANTVGLGNTAVGNLALSSNLAASYNTAVGLQSQESGTTGSGNTTMGIQSMQKNLSGGNNTALGYQAMQQSSNGLGAVGTITPGAGYVDGTYRAVLTTLVSGTVPLVFPRVNVSVVGGVVTTVSVTGRGTGVGLDSIFTVPAASIGGAGAGFQFAVSTLLSSSNLVALGYRSGRNALSSNNTYLGAQAGNDAGGSTNTAVGYNAMSNPSSGSTNVAVGGDALALLEDGNNNVAVGWRAGYLNTAGGSNVAIGLEAMRNNTVSSSTTAVGHRAMAQAGTGAATFTINNAGTGYVDGTYTDVATTSVGGTVPTTLPQATVTVAGGVVTVATMSRPGVRLDTTTTLTIPAASLGGSGSGLVLQVASVLTHSAVVAVGYQSLQNNVGSNNTAVGYAALTDNRNGASNTAVGTNTLISNTTGNNNTAIGSLALTANTTGVDNTAIGLTALDANTTGSFNTAAGRDALGSVTTGTSNTAVGYQAATSLTTGANNTVLGNQAQASAATVSNEVTLGNTSVTTLRCNVTSITALSDARDKTDISDLPIGLDFVNALRPVKFTWDARDGSRVGIEEAGFLAQDVLAAQGDNAYLQLVYASNPERLELTQGRLIPILVKAMQELSMQNAALAQRVAALEAN